MNICPVQIKSSFYQHFPGTGCIQQYLPDTLDHVTLLHEIEKFVKWQQQYDHSSLTEKVIFCQTLSFIVIFLVQGWEWIITKPLCFSAADNPPPSSQCFMNSLWGMKQDDGVMYLNIISYQICYQKTLYNIYIDGAKIDKRIYILDFQNVLNFYRRTDTQLYKD